MKDFIYSIDQNVGEFFHKIYLWGGEVVNKIMEGISLLGEAGILFLLIAFILILFKRTRKTGGLIILSIGLGFIFTNVILKNLIERARPFQEVGSDFYKWWLDAGSIKESGFSFPSGHTTAATCFALAIFYTTNKEKSWWVLLFPILMASSRIYLMVHYFTDCVGGLLVGGLSAIIAYLIIKWIYSSKIRLFVWAREVNLFKKREAKKEPLKADNNQALIVDQEYVTLQEENKRKTDD